jgi:ubiquinone/menaquinone biosynthesis C-methylase UbiE
MQLRRNSNTNLVKSEFKNNPWIPINYLRLLSGIKIQKSSVLIIGANAGYEASLFLRDGAKSVVGIDVFSAKLMFKHRRYKFVESAAESLPFSDNQFDIVYSQAVLEHVRDVGLTWQESLRVTKSGGFVAHMASPLWYSKDGHHRPDLFGEYPWCHIGRSLSEWKTWAESISEFSMRLSEVHKAMEYCMDEGNINQQRPQIYSDSLRELPNAEVVEDYFDFDAEVESVPSELMARIPLGLTEKDLRKITHCGILKKV